MKKSGGMMVRRAMGIIRKDYVGVMKWGDIERMCGLRGEELVKEFRGAGYEVEGSSPEEWIESLRGMVRWEKIERMVGMQESWMEASEKGFEYVTSKAFKEYGDKAGEIQELRLVVKKSDDSNVEIG